MNVEGWGYWGRGMGYLWYWAGGDIAVQIAAGGSPILHTCKRELPKYVITLHVLMESPEFRIPFGRTEDEACLYLTRVPTESE